MDPWAIVVLVLGGVGSLFNLLIQRALAGMDAFEDRTETALTGHERRIAYIEGRCGITSICPEVWRG